MAQAPEKQLTGTGEWIYLPRLICKLNTILYCGVMPLMLDLRTLRSTVAHGVQIFIHRLFHVLKIKGGWRAQKLTIFGQNIFLPAAFFWLVVLLDLPFLKGRVQAAHEFFKSIFLFCINNVIFAVQLRHYSTHDSTLTRVMARGAKYITLNNILLITLIRGILKRV